MSAPVHPRSSGGSIYEYTLETKRYRLLRKHAHVSAFGVDFRTSDLGFRDDGPSLPEKPPDGYRIIVLGDSFTICAGVEFDRIFTNLAERELRRKWPRLEVVNLEVGGYNVLQYRMLLEEVGLGLDPDMVVVAAFRINDFSNDTYEFDRRIALGQEQPGAPTLFRRTCVYHAYLASAIFKLRTALGRTSSKPQWKIDADWEENLVALGAIRDIAKWRDLPVTVVMLPDTVDFDGQVAIFDRLKHYLERERISYLDLLEPFRSDGTREASLRLNALDRHPNERYNAAVAGSLARHPREIVAADESAAGVE